MNLDPYIAQARADLEHLISFESVSAQRRMLPETATALMKLLEAEGFVVRRFAGQVAPILVAEAGAGPRTLLIYNHYDVQPEVPLELWDSPPFRATERDGRLYGRGMSDDKGEIAVRLGALRALRDRHGGSLPLCVRWLLEGEEEIGSPSLGQFVAEHVDLLRADGCLWESGSIDPQGRPVLIAGLKGIVCVELRARVAESDLHSSMGAVVDNPLWRLAKAIASLRDESGRVLIPGFYDHVRPPSEADLAAIARIPDERDAVREAYGIREFFDEGKRYYERLGLEPVVNINGLHGGYGDAGAKTVLPAAAFAKLDFRLVPDQEPAQIVELLRDHLKHEGLSDIEVIELETREHPARSDLESSVIRCAAQAAREIFGCEPVLYPSAGGGGPMHPFITHLGVPIVSAGVSNYASRAHAPNENIMLAHFAQGMAFALSFFGHVAKM